MHRPVGRPKGSKSKPYFGDTHPLAATARLVCAENGHGKGHIKVGGVACGPCWELAIRADQFRNAAAVEASGAGLRLVGEDATPDAIAAAVGRLLAEASYAAAARRLAAEIAAMPSPDDVAARLTSSS